MSGRLGRSYELCYVVLREENTLTVPIHSRQQWGTLLSTANLGCKTLQRARGLERIRVDGGVQERTNLRLGVRRLGADVITGVSVGLGDTHDVDIAVVTCLEEVLTLQVIGTDGVHGGPRGTNLTLGEELGGRQGGLAIRRLRRGGATLQSLDGDGIATHTMGDAHVGTLVGQRTLRT